jgi:branched-chain amino acid transport system substrate-binding protein
VAALVILLLALGNCAVQGERPSKIQSIKIATQSPLSGPLAVLGEALKLGGQLAIEKFSASIESAGFAVELVPFDDQGKPEASVVNARKLIADPDILLVIGHVTSGAAIPASEVYREVNIAIISPANTSPLFTDRGYSNVNRVIGRDDVMAQVGAQFAREDLRAATAFVVHDGTVYGQGGAEGFRQFARRIDLTIVGYEGFPGYERNRAHDFSAILGRIVASHPDVVYFGGIYDQAALLFEQAREAGVRAAFLGSEGMDSSDLVKMGGQAVVGLHYVIGAWPIGHYPETREFAREFRSRFAKEPGLYAVEAYDATLVGLKAIELALQQTGGSRPTRQQVSAAIRQLPEIRGLTGPISFDGNGDRRLARYFVFRVESPDPTSWEKNRLVRTFDTPPRSRR